MWLNSISSLRSLTSFRVNKVNKPFNMLHTFTNITKSAKDTRTYRGLQLDNNMKCLLISDPTTDRSAASVDCHVGYMLDTNEFPGYLY